MTDRDRKLEAEVQSLVAPLKSLVEEFAVSVHSFVCRHLEEQELKIVRLKRVAQASEDRASEERMRREKAERPATRKAVCGLNMTCGTCRWWSPHAPSAMIGNCRRFEAADGEQGDRGTAKLVVTRTVDGEATITTHHDFGCIQHDRLAVKGAGD